MGVDSAFEIVGIYCWFYSHDHTPPHFHAKRSGAWHVKVHFLLPEDQMIEIVNGKKKLLGKDRRLLVKQAKAHRFALLGEWELKVKVS